MIDDLFSLLPLPEIDDALDRPASSNSADMFFFLVVLSISIDSHFEQLAYINKERICENLLRREVLYSKGSIVLPPVGLEWSGHDYGGPSHNSIRQTLCNA